MLVSSLLVLHFVSAFALTTFQPKSVTSCSHRISFRLNKIRTSTGLLYSPQNKIDGDTSQFNEISSSSRAQRKAAERAKKQKRQNSATRHKTKLESDHPEAILKRQQKKKQQQNPKKFEVGGGSKSKRKHNFAERKAFLLESEKENDEFDVNMDDLRENNRLTNTNFHPINGSDALERSIHEHKLHSQSVGKLDASTTADEVVKAIKRAQNLHDLHDIREIAHFLLEEVGPNFAYGYRGSLLSRLAVASLHLNNHDIAIRCITERRINHRATMIPLESSAIVRGLLRCRYTEEAWEVLEDELSLPLEGWVDFSSVSKHDMGDASTKSTNEEDLLHEENTRRQLEVRDRLIHRARSIASIASRHFYEDEPGAGMNAMKKLNEMGKIVNEAGLTSEEIGMPWERIVKGAAMCESKRRSGKWEDENSSEDPSTWPCNIVYSVLDAMISFPPENRDVTFEALCNALVRRTVFVTGAVDMKGCPEADRGEVAFIGRSNVGKSSLVNMLTNRKSLAFTSKTPGKTQQFNYFAVNDKPDLERQIRFGDEVPGTKDLDAFYIVDLPGFGFAKVPQKQRQQWSDFMDEYLQYRATLRVVFHLIDARHGPTEEDGKIMQRVGRLLGNQQNRAKYVVILTKADKNVKGATLEKNPGKVTKSVLSKVVETMNTNRVGYAPIVLTSAETKLGRDEVWKYLRLAAEF